MPQQGFSLIELLMGLAIGAIVLLLVSPAFATLKESNHRDQAAQSLLDGLRNARTLAITPTHLSRVVRQATGRNASSLIDERLIRQLATGAFMERADELLDLRATYGACPSFGLNVDGVEAQTIFIDDAIDALIT